MGDDRTRLAVLALFALVVTAGCIGTPAGEADTTIQFQNATSESGLQYATTGGGPGNGNAGVYVADVDRDGWRDVLAIGGERPALFANENGTFARTGALSGLEGEFKSAVFVDYDGDGWEDLVLLRGYDYPLVMHNANGTLERAGRAGLGNFTYPLGATTADYDRDGDVDLFVYQSGDWMTTKPAGYFSLYGHIPEDNGNPNVLYENTDDGFERATDAGIQAERWTLAASFVDLNDDGLPDIHVANDYNNDTVYLNRGDGTFEERLLSERTARNGMASEIGDFNRDGHPDVFTTNIELPIRDEMSQERYERLRHLLSYVLHSGRTEGNTLMLNDGNGRFHDAAPNYSVRVGGWGWAASHTDLDSDGETDLVHSTQHVVRVDADDPHYTYPMVWERTGSNFTNLDAAERGFNETDGRGLTTLDYDRDGDRDGDRDVIIAGYDSRIHVYENVGANGNALQLRAVEADGSTVYGTTITVTANGESTTIQQTSRTDFLSQESRVNHVGLGSAGSATVEVTWPDGRTLTLSGVEANQQLRLTPDGVETVWSWAEG